MSCDKICNICTWFDFRFNIIHCIYIPKDWRQKWRTKQINKPFDASFQPLSSDLFRHQLILHVLIKYRKFPVFSFALTSGMVKLILVDSVWDSHLAERLWKLVRRLRVSLHTCSERQTRWKDSINHLRH